MSTLESSLCEHLRFFSVDNKFHSCFFLFLTLKKKKIPPPQHLHAKGRKDDLFSDPCYQQFGEELNKVLKDWKPAVLPDGESGNIHTVLFSL